MFWCRLDCAKSIILQLCRYALIVADSGPDGMASVVRDGLRRELEVLMVRTEIATSVLLGFATRFSEAFDARTIVRSHLEWAAYGTAGHSERGFCM